MTDPDPRSAEGDAAVLLDQVMRGERTLLFPPGSLVASLVVPCFAAAATTLAMAGALTVAATAATIVAALVAALALTAVAAIAHVLVALGRARHRRWLRVYARTLLAGAGGCALMGAALGAPVPWRLLALSAGALVSCDLMLGSHAYLAFASFLSLKRAYRENQAAASARVLGKHDA